jgi:hypothetical protein
MKLNQPLIISLLLHVCFYLLALLTPDQGLFDQEAVPLEVVYQNESKTRQIVTDPDQDRLLESLKKLETQANRLSRITPRVKEESVARKSGQTQNGGASNARALAPTESQKKSPTTAEQKSTNSSLDEIVKNELSQAPSLEQNDITETERPSITQPMNAPKKSFAGGGPTGVGRNTHTGDASLSEFIPEVRNGGFTALNTDQFVHYTFYARINEQIRSRWIENVREFLSRTPQTEVNRLASKTQNSQVEILLDSTGHFVKAIIHRHAENPGLDESAISAFRRASPLNNPPSEMVEEDGYIHLHYGFYVQFRPRYMASGSK